MRPLARIPGHVIRTHKRRVQLMVDSRPPAPGGDERGKRSDGCEAPAVAGNPPVRKSKSMHEGVAVWCDCCSCAAEPYWLAVAEEMGIDLGSDYEE